MAAPQPLSSLKGKHLWLTAPANAAGLCGGVLSTCYGYVMFNFPEGSAKTFFLTALAVIFVGTVCGTLAERRVLRALRRLGRGDEPDHATLIEAARETARTPRRELWITLTLWAVLPAALGLIFRFEDSRVSWLFALRIAGLGAIFGPIAGVLTYSLVVVRSRTLLEELMAAGLAPAEMISILPRPKLQLRPRFVLLTALAFFTPTVLAADVSLTLTRRRWERLVLVDRARSPPGLAEAVSQGGISLVSLTGLTLLLALGTAYLLGRAVGSPLREIADEAQRMASGDLTRSRVVPAEDDTWIVSSAFHTLFEYLVSILYQLQRAGDQITASSERILFASAAQAQSAKWQAHALDQTSVTTSSLAEVASANAGMAAAVSGLSVSTVAAATAGEQGAQTFFAAMLQVRTENQAIAEAVEALNQRVSQIGKIVESIRQVADQSDLLAVNAELEGDRAGEVGAGFSLVAAELRRLAEGVVAATQQIESLIAEIQEGTKMAVGATREGASSSETGTQLAGEISESFRRVLDLARRTSSAIEGITGASQRQRQGTNALADAMSGVLRFTQDNSVATQQMSQASVDLSKLAQELKLAAGGFRILAKPREVL